MKHKRELQINTNTPAEVSNETRAEHYRFSSKNPCGDWQEHHCSHWFNKPPEPDSKHGPDQWITNQAVPKNAKQRFIK
jgi:hypothetical protein